MANPELSLSAAADEARPAASSTARPRPVRTWLVRSGTGVRHAAGRAGATWRRSLQLRVGTTTVIVAGLVVLVIGLFLVDKVAGGVLTAKQNAAVSQARIGLQTANAAFADVDAQVPADVDVARQQVYASVTAVNSSAGAGLFTIAIESSTVPSDDVESVRIPDSLRDAVRDGNLATQYAPVHPSATSADFVAGLIVGEPVQARSGVFELYYLFPLTAEQQTIALIQRTVVLAGLALVVLVLGIALLVTRQVVRPLRVARETAGRLAAGDLSKRIAVTGSDDIARLGQSFNDMADSLQRQIRRLEDLSRLQRRFTSDVSHELRTPLTTIRMASEFLYASRDEFEPELTRAAELMHDELDRFESLLGDLLEISRHDAGAAHLESAPVDVRSVVATAIEGVQVLAAAHGSEMIVAQPDVPVTVDIDSRRVERILRNLLGNALDHGEGKPVVLTVGYDADAVAIAVRDHGIGLRPGEAGLVFNRFWRGDPSRSRLTGGTGLGLAISLEDARLHDGWLQAWGERGRGAQFRLTLPRRAGHTLMHSPLPLDPDEDPDEDFGDADDGEGAR
ncbi:two-component system, OmpR family, sensor histidine kinase MtrB [Jatrophihabitans endophyticus]|uniref:Sensor histidine kinase MtrB n=1 Tax=Jatrophihabitans endophyticus TaxID=1206085 RepID=A0A1M5EYI8_9ACTN|nr:MtrAB system histidine kinase MtrB [Jatrophihabitans endophyticus]SHF84227.1 two-component system, OmpR family, sensor histidine kinase MtrB [Jatrophihabitans endophyticus]